MQKPEASTPSPSPLPRFEGEGWGEGAKFTQGGILQHLAKGLGKQPRPKREFRMLEIFCP